MQYRCSIHWMYTSQTLQYILQVHCNYLEVYMQCMRYCMRSIYCSYTVLTAVHLQYTLHYTASILHFGLGLTSTCTLPLRYSLSHTERNKI